MSLTAQLNDPVTAIGQTLIMGDEYQRSRLGANVSHQQIKDLCRIAGIEIARGLIG
jgi:hypothetical protein